MLEWVSGAHRNKNGAFARRALDYRQRLRGLGLIRPIASHRARAADSKWTRCQYRHQRRAPTSIIASTARCTALSSIASTSASSCAISCRNRDRTFGCNSAATRRYRLSARVALRSRVLPCVLPKLLCLPRRLVGPALRRRSKALHPLFEDAHLGRVLMFGIVSPKRYFAGRNGT